MIGGEFGGGVGCVLGFDFCTVELHPAAAARAKSGSERRWAGGCVGVAVGAGPRSHQVLAGGKDLGGGGSRGAAVAVHAGQQDLHDVARHDDDEAGGGGVGARVRAVGAGQVALDLQDAARGRGVGGRGGRGGPPRVVRGMVVGSVGVYCSCCEDLVGCPPWASRRRSQEQVWHAVLLCQAVHSRQTK